MPREGYSVVTIKNKLKQKLEKVADKNQESIPETIEMLVDEYLLDNCKMEA